MHQYQENWQLKGSPHQSPSRESRSARWQLTRRRSAPPTSPTLGCPTHGLHRVLTDSNIEFHDSNMEYSRHLFQHALSAVSPARVSRHIATLLRCPSHAGHEAACSLKFLRLVASTSPNLCAGKPQLSVVPQPCTKPSAMRHKPVPKPGTIQAPPKNPWK